jgi:hypothetical protein
MAFKTFDQLDAESLPASLYVDPNAGRKQEDPLAAYFSKPAPSVADTLSAAFESGNFVGSVIARKDTGMDNHDDGVYNPINYMKANGLYGKGYDDRFSHILNTAYADQVKSQIDMENRNNETMAASGWTGIAAGLAAGVFDLPSLIPGTVAVRGAKGGWAIGKSMLMGGISAAAAATASEAGLQMTQDTRSGSESLVNIGAAAVIGSLIGGGAAAVLSKAERATVTRGMENMADVNSGKVPNTLFDAEGVPHSGGAAVNPDYEGEGVQRTREETQITGNVTRKIAETTRALNPKLAMATSPSPVTRQLGLDLFGSGGVTRDMHLEGNTTGRGVDEASRTLVASYLNEANRVSKAAYDDMRSSVGGNSGERLSEKQFHELTGEAMFNNNDQSDNAFVARAAVAHRKLVDYFTQQALDLGQKLKDQGVGDDHPFVALLKDGAMDLKNAVSYLHKMPNRDRLLVDEPKFLDKIGKFYTDSFNEAYGSQLEAHNAALAKIKQRTEDMNLAGPARAQRIQDLNAQAKALDANHVHLNDDIDALAEAKGRLRSGDKTASEDIKAITARGGEQLANYIDQRSKLHSRMSSLTENNADAQLARGEQLSQRIDDMHELTQRSLGAFAQRAKNVLNSIAGDPIGVAEEKIAALEAQAHAAQAKVVRQQDYLAHIQDGDADPARVAMHADRLAKMEAALADVTETLRHHADVGPASAEARAQKLDNLMQTIKEEQAARDLRRGEQLARIKERAAKLSPEAVAERAKANAEKNAAIQSRLETSFERRWGPSLELGRKMEEINPFEAAGRQAAGEYYDAITGRTADRGDTPSFITRETSGPYRGRVNPVPQALMAQHGWLETDVRTVSQHYARNMASELELTRKFIYADMREQLGVNGTIATHYRSMREAVANAQTVADVNAVFGEKKFNLKKDVKDIQEKAQAALMAGEAEDVRNAKGGRDIIRGNYQTELNNSNYASIMRSAANYNSARFNTGFLFKNFTDIYAPAFIHGLSPWLKAFPQALAGMFGAGSPGSKLVLRELEQAGLIATRFNHALINHASDVGDPFLPAITSLERFSRKMAGIGSKWSGMNWLSDFTQSISGIISQHRIMEAILGNDNGTFLRGEGEPLLRKLGINPSEQADIAKLYAAHGEEIDGTKVANTDKWIAAAEATGNPAEIARVDRAVRAYRTAINADVSGIAGHAGAGDRPLFAHTPMGGLLLQFTSYTTTAHTSIMMRGMQGEKSRFLSGLVAMTAIGGLASYIQAFRSGQERWQKYLKDTTDNPALLIKDSLDNSSIFPLAFDISNRLERISGSIGQQYRVNPITTPLSFMLGRGASLGQQSARASDSSGAIGAVLGPTGGLIDSGFAAARVVGDMLHGKTSAKRDQNLAEASLPYEAHPLIRGIIQSLTDNSPLYNIRGN